jgi:threonine/homoserine/homoserine lactone efflux protein
MSQFLLVAAAHFLALLSPGPDFFLIARTALAGRWRSVAAVCLGVAIGNAVFIAMAFGGSRLLSEGSPAFLALQIAGACYLLWLGVLFLRHAGQGSMQLGGQTRGNVPAPGAALVMGLLSALLNPKNALFYASLVAVLGPVRSPGRDLAYGVWMFAIVLLWDLLVAGLIGHRAVLRRFVAALPWLERLTGAVLLLMAGLVVAMLLRTLNA